MPDTRLNENFQKFLQTIRNWPQNTIDKSALIKMLNDLIDRNPELQNHYDTAGINHVEESSPPTIEPYSQVRPDDYEPLQPEPVTESRPSRTVDEKQMTARKDSSYTPSSAFVEKVVIKQGDLTVRKGSSTLSALVKSLGSKTIYCELSAAYHNGEKLAYFTVYQNKKLQKVVHKFLLDETCSFTNEPKSKRDFHFKHGSAVEYFTTESGTAESWTSAFASMLSHIVEDIYEVPDSFIPVPVPVEPVTEERFRVPPRPARHTNAMAPDKVYVCLYDHVSLKNDSRELEFNRGDLLYIINKDGPQFYVGYKLSVPWTPDHQSPLGLVFKDYIQPAYEKAN